MNEDLRYFIFGFLGVGAFRIIEVSVCYLFPIVCECISKK